VLLAATLASLVLTILAGYLTRVSLVEATAWVTHTDDVKLAIDDCKIALARGDVDALRRSVDLFGRLTVDNERQRRNVALATTTQSRDALEALFDAMQGEEEVLMRERLARIETARAESSAAFVAGSVLTVVLGIGAFAVLRQQRSELFEQEALLEAILESVDEGIIAIAPSRKVIAINAAARALWGGAPPRNQWPEDWRLTLRATFEDGTEMRPEDGPLARALRGEASEKVVYRVGPADAPPSAGRWISASARTIRNEDGRTVAAVTTLRDISEQRADAERLRDESVTDALTGLLNRRGFLIAANVIIAKAAPSRTPTALLYADVNGLKRINDDLGHEQGDRAIEDAARTLRAVFREGDVVARIGGDEFVAILPNFSPDARDLLLERLATSIRAHNDSGARPYRLSMSSGITFVEWDRQQSLEELLSEADRLMYQRKRTRAGQSMPVIPTARATKA
jgi:diguanylate cyclase (GGDEF)-like protein